MNSSSPLFAQVMGYLSHRQFERCVKKYDGNFATKGFSCRDQFLCMAFAQLTYRHSLRDIETCLRSQGSKLYHLGIRGKVSRSTLAYANNKRSWRIYEELGKVLIAEARRLYSNDKFIADLKGCAYALDSSIIGLCLTLCPWAKYRDGSAGIKLHTLLDLHGNIPTFMSISSANKADHPFLDQIFYEAGAFYVMDRGYFDLKRLYAINTARAFFVIRPKSSFTYRVVHIVKRRKNGAIRSDLHIRTANFRVKKRYPDTFRLVTYFDRKSNRTFNFMTNNFSLHPIVIAQLYKSRWQIELFFKWIKQHLRIKTFFGTSPNAVRTQIWIAICVFLLVAIIKKKLKSKASLHSIFQVLSINAVTKTPISRAFHDISTHMPDDNADNQLNLQDVYLGQ